MEIWQAEHDVDAERARFLIEGQFPELAPAALARVGEGFDNNAYLANGSWLFRFPRRTQAVRLLQNECALLPALAETALPLAIPRPVWIGMPAGDYPWPFAGYAYIDGVIPEAAESPDWETSARRTGDFLRVLHGFPVERARKLGAPGDTIKRLDYEGRMAALENNMAEAETRRLWHGGKAVMALIAELRETSAEPAESAVLVHGDLHVRNVLLDDRGVLSAVVDWGDVHIGHPAVDLSFAYGCLPPDHRPAFFASYGAVSRRTELLARYRAVFTYLYLVLYGAERHNPRLEAAARRCLNNALFV